ncbi:very-long-chain (3R)-3-hydroxyacyl-CoA dehydratase [Centruroides vittatus]|uniref:very-long-chain (3R)-3-hydroxyacyl-CoA dehydratase n=1 Tax=Centruroides vittatus TaxID=120091 RepID=UPI00350FCFB0
MGSVSTLSPFVYWAQTEKNLSLRVDLRNVKAPKVSLTCNELEFSANGIGAKGENQYYFTIKFYQNVDPDDSQYRITDREVDFSIVKKEEEWWPRLIAEKKKPVWLKIDFDRLKTEDDESDGENLLEHRRSTYDDLLDDLAKSRRKTKKKVEDFRKIYLLLYNLFQFVGFLYCLIVISIRYAKDGPLSMEGTYGAIGKAFQFCTLMQLLEILHPLLGYTSGNAVFPTVQVFGRVTMLFLMIGGEPRMQTKPVVFYLLLIYATIEVIRYPYYMLRTYSVDIGILTWLRYTIWIPFYPLGFLCEGVIILRNIPYFEETKKFSLELPNAWNFSLHFPTLMRVYLLMGFFPTLYCLMNNMYKQRVKILGEKRKEKSL